MDHAVADGTLAGHDDTLAQRTILAKRRHSLDHLVQMDIQDAPTSSPSTHPISL